jgi:hypothetical protein
MFNSESGGDDDLGGTPESQNVEPNVQNSRDDIKSNLSKATSLIYTTVNLVDLVFMY